MAGKIEQGFGSDPDEVEDTRFVEFTTPAFSAVAINMYRMPGDMVLDVITTPGVMQMPKMVSMFRLAINDPKKADDSLLLDFTELREAINAWIEASTPPKKQLTVEVEL